MFQLLSIGSSGLFVVSMVVKLLTLLCVPSLTVLLTFLYNRLPGNAFPSAEKISSKRVRVSPSDFRVAEPCQVVVGLGKMCRAAPDADELCA
jgi:hypothetical protein